LLSPKYCRTFASPNNNELITTIMKKYILMFVAGVMGVAMTSCSDDNNNDSTGDTSRMSVKLVDAPGDYDEVNIDVEDVVIKYEGDVNLDGEVEYDDNEIQIGAVNTGVYNMLELTGGEFVLLTDDEVPAGRISQIRLILGSDNTVVVDGETHPLQTPSAQQSGLKLNINQTLEANTTYTFTLDFDVDASIVEQGNGGYLLKPTIRAFADEATGQITGTVLGEFDTMVTATSQTGLVVTSYTNDMGNFVLNGLPEGVYDLTIESEVALGVTTTVTIEDVAVVNGEVKSVGEITVQE